MVTIMDFAYPYITMIQEFSYEYNYQIVIEGCNKFKNFKAILTKDFFLNEYQLELIYTELNKNRPCLYTFFEICKIYKHFPQEEFIKLYAILSKEQLQYTPI